MIADSTSSFKRYTFITYLKFGGALDVVMAPIPLYDGERIVRPGYIPSRADIAAVYVHKLHESDNPPKTCVDIHPGERSVDYYRYEMITVRSAGVDIDIEKLRKYLFRKLKTLVPDCEKKCAVVRTWISGIGGADSLVGAELFNVVRHAIDVEIAYHFTKGIVDFNDARVRKLYDVYISGSSVYFEPVYMMTRPVTMCYECFLDGTTIICHVTPSALTLPTSPMMTDHRKRRDVRSPRRKDMRTRA